MRNILAFLKENKHTIAFLLIYTVIFILYTHFFIFLLPITIGLLLAVIGSLPYSLLKNKIKLRAKLAANLTSVMIAVLFFVILVLFIYFLIKEITLIQSNNGMFQISALHPRVQKFINNMLSNIKKQTLDGGISFLSTTLFTAAPTVLKKLVSIPSVFLLFLLSFFFCNIFLQANVKLLPVLNRVFGKKVIQNIAQLLTNKINKPSGFILSYLIIYSVTFTEALIILYLLKTKYPIITAFAITISDIFPVLGPGIILLPFSVYKLLCGDFARAIGLSVGWLLISVIRQIIEPKLISNITKTPNLIMWVAVYISLLTSNFWIIPYTAILFFLYPLFKEYNEGNSKAPCDLR